MQEETRFPLAFCFSHSFATEEFFHCVVANGIFIIFEKIKLFGVCKSRQWYKRDKFR